MFIGFSEITYLFFSPLCYIIGLVSLVFFQLKIRVELEDKPPVTERLLMPEAF